MKFVPYAKSLAVALSLAVMAGCSSTGGTQDGSFDGSGTAGGTGMGGGTSGQGVSSGQVSGSQLGGEGSQQQAGIPDVRTIYFGFDQDTIRPEFESVLNAHAQYLRSHPDAHVVLQGHADERGTREYNLGLGERRAQAVEQYLSVQGVSPSQIDVVSYGEERPAVEGHSEQSYAKNRRVVVAY